MPRPAIVPLRYREFRLLWLASIVSNLGSFLQTVAASWLMLQLTGSAFWVGLMVAAPTLPLLVIAMPAGAMADLFERRRIILVSQCVMALTAALTAVLGLAGLLTPGVLLGLGLLLGTGTAFNLPSWQAMVPDLVPNHHVASAVALNSAAFNVARAVGPALGGLLVATVGPESAFALNAVSYLAVVVAVATFPRRALSQDHESMGTAIAAGLRYARFTPSYRWVLLVAAAFALCSAVVQAVLPTFTAERLSGGADVYGILLGAMGVGALIGAFTRPAVAARLRRRMVPGSISAFGLAGVGLGLSASVVTAVPALVVAGTLWVWILATLNATAQLLSPGWVRGRIMSLYTVSFLGLLPLGSILAGSLASLTSAGTALVGISAATVLLGLLVGATPLPVLEDVISPQPADLAPSAHEADVTIGGTVMVVNSWQVAPADREVFLILLQELRRIRLRTGAFRWRLYRAVDDPDRITELFVLPSWEEHLRQHGRLDAEAAAVIMRTRAFDVGEGPLTRHLVSVDVTDAAAHADWERQVSLHAAMHRSDGSLPLREEPPEPGDAPGTGRAGASGPGASPPASAPPPGASGPSDGPPPSTRPGARRPRP